MKTRPLSCHNSPAFERIALDRRALPQAWASGRSSGARTTATRDELGKRWDSAEGCSSRPLLAVWNRPWNEWLRFPRQSGFQEQWAVPIMQVTDLWRARVPLVMRLRGLYC